MLTGKCNSKLGAYSNRYASLRRTNHLSTVSSANELVYTTQNPAGMAANMNTATLHA